jgi:hypothetical protein
MILRARSIRHAIGLVLTALAVSWCVQALAADAIETVVRSSAASQPAPGLTIAYRDMDSFHGGTAIEIRGDGTFLRWDSAGMREAYTAVESEGKIEASRLAPLLKMLVDLEAWRQLTPERRGVPDESRASLVLSAGSDRSFVWEWYNEMQANKRIVLIRDQMETLAPKGTQHCVLPFPPRSSQSPPGIRTCKGPA